MKTLRIMMVMLIMVSLLTMLSSCKKAEKTSKAPTTPGSASVTTSKVQTTCPIEGGKIDKSMYADAQGQRVYFCCADCKAKFNADPAKYIKQMEDQGMVLEKTPK